MGPKTWTLLGVATMAILWGAAVGARAAKPGPETRVNAVRVRAGGIQPQIVMDDAGVLHLIYFRGDAAQGDLFYVRSADGGASFSAPIAVNSHPGSAIATGNIRGAHVAVGRNGRVYAAWNGTYEVDRPAAAKPWMKHPMLFARLNDAGDAFEPERNLIHEAYGLDGGGALAADHAGNVYVFWHASAPGLEGEANRRGWMARSTDDGRTFQEERAAFAEATGACGCCGMSAFADRRGGLYLLYRSASETVHRDMYLLFSSDHGQTLRGTNIAPWNIGACTMSLEDFAESPGGFWPLGRRRATSIMEPSTRPPALCSPQRRCRARPRGANIPWWRAITVGKRWWLGRRG